MNNTETAIMMENTATTSSTTQYEMVEQLAHKCGVTLEEAKAALEANNWNVLTATYQLEQETFKRKQELNNILSSQEDTTTDQTAKASSEQVQSVDDHQTEADEKKTQKKTKKTGDAMKKLRLHDHGPDQARQPQPLCHPQERRTAAGHARYHPGTAPARELRDMRVSDGAWTVLRLPIYD